MRWLPGVILAGAMTGGATCAAGPGALRISAGFAPRDRSPGTRTQPGKIAFSVNPAGFRLCFPKGEDMNQTERRALYQAAECSRTGYV